MDYKRRLGEIKKKGVTGESQRPRENIKDAKEGQVL